MLNPAVEAVSFAAGTAVSLRASAVFVTRIERVGEHLHLSEAVLGILAALAADSPEITSAVTAIATHQVEVGAGVVLGSAVFNLTALLGIGAVVAGRIEMHRRVILLGGVVATLVASCGLVTLAGAAPPPAGLAAAALILVSYVVLLAFGGDEGFLVRIGAPRPVAGWLARAVNEEGLELSDAIHPAVGRPIDGLVDGLVGGGALVAVVIASVVMERTASSLGNRLGVPDIVVGALVLGVVTGIPNAVASTYLARRGRAAAALSTALNSNNFNFTIGLLIPAAAVGIGSPSGGSLLAAAWCLALTALTLVGAYRDSGLRRRSGIVILLAYAGFAGSVVGFGVAG